jgi:hypothetical protein
MKSANNSRGIFVEAAAVVFALLFLYTGADKLATHDRFLLTLQQSPIIPNALAPVIAWAVPISEIIIAAMLLHAPWRRAGMYLFLLAMFAFTGYLFVVIYHTNYVPCGCGGIIESLSWKGHLLLNTGLCLLAAACLWIMKAHKRTNRQLLPA